MNETSANYDQAWKEAIGEYFEQFLSFFFPRVYHLIDWSQNPISLEKELQKITADSHERQRFVDKLFQVWLKDGLEVWILVHIEVQSQHDRHFSQRMYIYNYRAFDLYRKEVISLAILGDESQSWRPDNYGYHLGGCEVKLKFPIAKLVDYQSRWEELESELNPFAMMIMAHLKTKATTSNLKEREQWKWLLIRKLYKKGYQKQEIIKLFKFIDVMMSLPKQLQKSLNQKIKKYEEERNMPLLSNMEKMAMEEGLQEGLQEGEKKGISLMIESILINRFGEIDDSLQAIIPQMLKLSTEELTPLLLSLSREDLLARFSTVS